MRALAFAVRRDDQFAIFRWNVDSWLGICFVGNRIAVND